MLTKQVNLKVSKALDFYKGVDELEQASNKKVIKCIPQCTPIVNP